MKLATWNINSVRLRAPLVERFLDEAEPDILCLQETKCPDTLFPHEPFETRGYAHRAIRGEKGYNGVAILSRLPFESAQEHRDFCGREDTRHLSVRVAGVTLHNLYIPAGGDEPDRDKNPKFGHKLDFVDELTDWFSPGGEAADGPSIAVGDFNIAPGEHDVWSHKQLLKVVSHTPVETDKLERLRASRDWLDVARAFVPDDEKLYSWWSYRSPDWAKADKGRRLDHIWVTPDLAPGVQRFSIEKPVRGWGKPSDHAPVVAEIDL